MSTQNDQPSAIADLYDQFARGGITRRDFMRRAAALGVAGTAASAIGTLISEPASAAALAAQAADAAGSLKLPLDVAEWSYMWVNVKRADTARASFVGGQQMYVEYMVPTRVRKPYAVVFVHGGGGQGLDWMGTPDGRPGWFQYMVAEGYRTYVVDRPGHGRSPIHPDLHGGLPARAGTMENLANNFIPPQDIAAERDPYRRNHTQWPGPGKVGGPDVAQFLASQGGSYVQQPQPPGAPGAGRAGGPGGAGAQNAAPVAANLQPAGLPNVAHMAWREAGADLLDKIGPAIIITHSAGGPFGLLTAEARPNLVKSTVIIEGAGTGFGGGNRWGLSTIPVTWDPPVSDPSEIKTVLTPSNEKDIADYFLQAEPVRKLPNLKDVKVLTVTAPASQAAPGNPGQVAFLKQAGVFAVEYRVERDANLHGNSHMMMVEKDNREVLQPILAWLDRNVNTGNAPLIRRRGTESTGMRLANAGYFWVGAEPKKMDYGTIVAGQMYVQYLIPADVRHPFPVVLVHGGGGQGTDYMGIDGNASWAHYYVQAGYQTYIVDRPGHGRSPFHPDALGPMGPLPTYDFPSSQFRRAATGTPRRWAGSGLPGDPLLDQFVAGQNAMMLNNDLAMQLWRSRGAMLLDRIGPAIIQTHSAGGSFGWLTADERPALVKAIVSFEGAGMPLVDFGSTAIAKTLPNLKGIPVLYFVAENSGFAEMGRPVVEALKQSGAAAEYLNLRDRGITGNSHFAMLESNRKEVFEVFRGWIEAKVPPATRQTARA